MSLGHSRTLLALALQSTALIALALALLGISWLDAWSRPRVLLLVDRSSSVPRSAADDAVADVLRAANAAGSGEVQLLEFAGRPGAPSPHATTTGADLQPSATNIESALDAALAAHAEAAFADAIIISDGLANAGDTLRALRATREAKLPLQWLPVGRAPPPTRIHDVLAPDHATAGQRIRVMVQLAGRLDRPLRVRATARTVDGETIAANGEPDNEGRAMIEFEARHNGAVLVDVALEDHASGQLLDAWPDAAVVDVAPRGAILYVQGSKGSLARSLLDGGWTLNVVPATRLDVHADRLDGYQAVVLDDVAISDASARFWSALAAAVRNRGLGLIVLGGERSFSRGGYRESTLESVLPVASNPPALDQAVSVVFAVDKSGSMGRGSAGVNRFQLAQRAVLETARDLTDRDTLGVVVFDVEPRLLMPLGPARDATRALERNWQASPHGGTKLGPALEAAIGELERSSGARRMLVVVTDGFVDEAPLDDLRARLDRAHIETIALAVGPDADAGALERLFGPGAGSVLRVNETAELPFVMRSGLERRRARIERGAIAVEQIQSLPFASGDLGAWPAIGAFAVTRSQPGAFVAVRTSRGDPLIAFRSAGRGRVVAVTCGLGQWTPQWVLWREWPRLAGGLAHWAGSSPPGGSVALAASDLPAGIQVEADVQTGMTWANPAGASIAVDAPTAGGRQISADHVAPGRLRATLPDAGAGLYTFLVSTSLGTQRLLHLRRNRTESETWGTNPALDAWLKAGLARNWDPRSLGQHREGDQVRRSADRWLVGLALALFLAGILVDRAEVLRGPWTWRPDRSA